jgi:prepilin-type N-terminal cleavage/methylation domain-containing protein
MRYTGTTTRNTTRPRGSASPRRRGFSLIEVIVALSLLAIGLSTMAALQAGMVVSARNNTVAKYRDALISQRVDYLQTLPSTGLGSVTGTWTVTTGFRHTLTVTEANPAPGPGRRRFTVTVTPTIVPTLARSVSVERSSKAACSLNVGSTTC